MIANPGHPSGGPRLRGTRGLYGAGRRRRFLSCTNPSCKWGSHEDCLCRYAGIRGVIAARGCAPS
ncbi:hypothetical protein SMJ63A_20394 [Stenotrophomonas geniculata]|nr:protein of unknown function [Stenotrophomonas maltophilia]